MKRNARRYPAPYQQGELDGLCGAYSIVNAVHYLYAPLPRKCSRTLLQQLLHCLEQREPIAQRVICGIELKKLKRAMCPSVLKPYPIRQDSPYKKRRALTLDEYWQDIGDFLATGRRLVLIAIGGRHDHWTLVRKVTAHSLLLYDSGGLKRLSRRVCALNRSDAVPHPMKFWRWH